MNRPQNKALDDLHLAKLGIREIRQRIEVNPIITDPGTAGLDHMGDGTKTYVCPIGVPSVQRLVGGE